MTSATGGYPQPPTTPMSGEGAAYGQSSTGQSTMDTAKEQAADMSQTVKDTGGQVASTVAEQARTVAGETTRQAKDLLNEAHTQLRDQAGAQKEKAVGGLHTLADGLRSMAEGNGAQAGVAGDLAKEAADKAKMMATWLEQRDPGNILNDIRNLARRRPGAFLLGAALAGVAAGRLTRGAIAAATPDSTPASYNQGIGTLGSNGYSTGGYRAPATMDQPLSGSFPRQDPYGQDPYRGTDTGYADTGYSPATTSARTGEPDYAAGYGIDELAAPDPAATLDGGR